MNSNLEKFSIEDNLKTKKKQRKNPLLFLILAVFLGILFFMNEYTNIFKFQKNNQIPENKTLKINLSLNDVKYELGSKIKKDKKIYVNNEIDLSKVIINFDKVTLDDEGLLSMVGDFIYEVVFEDEKKTGKIIVQDTNPPQVKTKIAYVPFGKEEIDADMFIRNVSDNSKNYIAEIINKENINTNIIGEIEIKLLVKDLSENKVEVNSKLIVLDSTYAEIFSMQDLNISYNDKNDNLWNKVITEKFESAITNSSSIFLSAMNRMSNYNWKEIINVRYPGAVIEESDNLILYNQDDLIVGITKRIKLKLNDESKYYYLEY